MRSGSQQSEASALQCSAGPAFPQTLPACSVAHFNCCMRKINTKRTTNTTTATAQKEISKRPLTLNVDLLVDGRLALGRKRLYAGKGGLGIGDGVGGGGQDGRHLQRCQKEGGEITAREWKRQAWSTDVRKEQPSSP